MYFGALLWGTQNLGLLYLLAKLILLCNQMSLFIFVVLCVVWILLCAIQIALSALLQLMFSWCIFLHLFNLSLSLYSKCVSCRQHIVSPCPFIHPYCQSLPFNPCIYSIFTKCNYQCFMLESAILPIVFCLSQLLLLLSFCSCLLFDCF